MKTKKLLTTFFILALGSIALTSCGNDKESSTTKPKESSIPSTPTKVPSNEESTTTTTTIIHEHTYDQDWTKTSDGHYKNCTCHPEVNEVIPHRDTIVDGICDDCEYVIREKITYTINTKDSNGSPLKNVYVGIKALDDTIIDSKYSDVDGIVTFELLEDEYILDIHHINAAFILQESNDILLDKENTTYTAVFKETFERISYYFYLNDTNGNKITSGINLFLYNQDNNVEGWYGFNSAGFAAANLVNDNYFCTLISKDGGYYYFTITKNEASTISITFDTQTKGGTKDNPIIVNDLLDKPFANKDNVNLDWDYKFEANEEMYVKILNANGKKFSIDGSKFSVIYNENEILANELGRIEITFDNLEANTDAIIKITAKENAVEDIELT